MSFPYPQDRHRDRREKGEFEYEQARQAMGEARETEQAAAEFAGEDSRDDRQATDDLESQLTDVARQVHQDLADERRRDEE